MLEIVRFSIKSAEWYPGLSIVFRAFVTFATCGAAVNFAACLSAIKLYSEVSEWWYGLPIISPNLAAESWLLLGTLYSGHSLVWGFIAGIFCATFSDDTGQLKTPTVAMAIAVSLVVVSVLAMFVIPAFNIFRLSMEKVAESYLQYFAVSIPSAAIAGLLSQWWVNRTTTR